MLKRLLLAAVGGGPFTPPPPSVVQVTAAPEGGWTEPQGPHIIGAGGHTFFSYVRGEADSNDIVAARFNHALGVTDQTFLLHAALSDGASTVPDQHNAGVILPLADGRLLTSFSGHQSTSMRSRLSSSALDVSAFGAEVVDTTAGLTKTYPQLGRISSGKVYRRFRGVSGANWSIWQQHSTDDGATWSTPLELIRMSGGVYSQMCGNGSDRIDHVATNRDPGSVGGYGLYYWYTDDASNHRRADDSLIGGDPSPFPWTIADVSEVFPDGSDRYPYQITPGADGLPVISWQTKQADPVLVGQSRLQPDGTWVHSTVYSSDPVLTTALTVGGGVAAWGDPNVVLGGKMIGGPLDLGGEIQIFLFTSSDNGATWDDGVQITTGAGNPSSPTAVNDPVAGLRWVWFRGDGPSGDGDPFSLGIEGLA